MVPVFSVYESVLSPSGRPHNLVLLLKYLAHPLRLETLSRCTLWPLVTMDPRLGVYALEIGHSYRQLLNDKVFRGCPMVRSLIELFTGTFFVIGLSRCRRMEPSIWGSSVEWSAVGQDFLLWWEVVLWSPTKLTSGQLNTISV